MKNIQDSIVADNGSTISNARISKTSFWGIESKKSFWIGFFSGIASSLVASAIWYLIQKYMIE
jgi:hypothetical protein